MKVNNIKTWLLVLIAALLVVVTGQAALAYSPYDGVNRIGTQYAQYSYGYYSYSYSSSSSGGLGYYTNAAAFDKFHYYPTAPRQAGFFGSGREHLIGLRQGVQYNLGPVAYTARAYPTCVWPYCHTGGAGYPRATIGDIRFRTRFGGFGSR